MFVLLERMNMKMKNLDAIGGMKKANHHVVPQIGPVVLKGWGRKIEHVGVVLVQKVVLFSNLMRNGIILSSKPLVKIGK
jgi:hypothetical protein